MKKKTTSKDVYKALTGKNPPRGGKTAKQTSKASTPKKSGGYARKPGSKAPTPKRRK